MDSCSANPTLFFACSGGTNAGQITNAVCQQLSAEGYGRLSCLAGICAQVSSMVKSAKGVKVVALDGCELKCARKALEAANVPISHHFVLADWGIKEKPNLFPSTEEVLKTKSRVLAIIE